MYPKYLVKDNNPQKNIELENPSFDQIIEAVYSLDGNQHSYLMLCPEADSDEMMVIGGGEKNEYICLYYNGDEYSLINPNETSNEKVAVFMGQMCIRKKYELVNIQSVLLAVKTYAESGTKDRTLTWKKN